MNKLTTKSQITISVDFLAGTRLCDALNEAKSLAIKLDVAYVTFCFNGVKFSIGQNADLYEAEQDYKNGDKKYGVIHA